MEIWTNYPTSKKSHVISNVSVISLAKTEWEQGEFVTINVGSASRQKGVYWCAVQVAATMVF